MSIEPQSHAGKAMARAGLSGWCIAHPVATTLLMLGAVLLGVLALLRLPISPMPEADLPTIQISAALPGADPETMASSVATPLEVQLSAVPGITEMTSSSALGTTTITLQFALSKDINVAAQEVQAAINTASGRLPADLPSAPTWRKLNPNDSPILVLRMNSALQTLTELSDLAETVLARRITQIDGVSEVAIAGLRRPALRIQVVPERLAAVGVTLADIRLALQRTSINQPTGAIFGEAQVSTLRTNSQIFLPKDYEDLVVAYRGDTPILLRDVAKVVNGAENDFVQAWPNGKPGVNLIIRRQPGANIVATADRIQAELPRLRELLPASVDVAVLNDRTRTIRSSLHEVEVTLAIAVGLVVLVMGIFLRQLSATLIVSGVLVVSLTFTAAAMYALGFSLNNLTLVALILAVGFVVDDAIVVVENIHRHLEEGSSGPQAARVGASEMGFTVASIGLSLVAAFIPMLFMDGVVGRLFREFAVTMTAAIVLSVITSLTLAPMLAARFMKSAPAAGKARFDVSGWLLRHYERGLDFALAHQKLTLLTFGLTVAAAAASYVFIPKGFFPLQDTAFVIGVTQAAEDIPYAQMADKHRQLAEIVGRDPAVQGFAHAIGQTGGSQSLSNGRFWVVLKDRSERDVSSEGFINRMRGQVSQVAGIQLFMRSAQDINIGAGSPRAQYQYTLRSNDSAVLREWSDRITTRLQSVPGLRDVSSDLQFGATQTRLEIDRTAAARYGLTADDVSQTLYDAFGQRQVAQVQTEVNQYYVVLEIGERQRGLVDSLQYFHLRAPQTGAMVPLAAVARQIPSQAGPVSISHDGMSPSVNVSFNLMPGVSLGDAVERVRAAETEMGVPTSISGSFRGNAQAFEAALANQPLLILAAVLAVYIILGALYESFVHPLTILSTLPSAGIGAVLALWIFGFDFSIMAMIGVILLIGIVKKNGILMIDFTLQLQREQGLSAAAAVRRACLVRFRPIMMTTVAALLGAIPLTFAFGTGSELRQPLGIAIVGGLLLSQVLTLFSTPVIYLALDRLRTRFQRRGASAYRRLPAPTPNGEAS